MVSVQDIRQPPILIHACKDFAAFSIRQKPEKMVVNIVDLISSTAALRESCSSLSSSSSDSDSSLCYRSPAVQQGQFELLPNCDISPLVDLDFLSSNGRSRSQSECGERSPLKGILKRRPMSRSFSECQEGNSAFIVKNYAIPRLDCSFGDDSCSVSVSDILDEEISAFNSLFLNKKSVTFSERVEENIFKPGSIILGQRNNKKTARKPKTRKRRESSESVLSSGADDNNNDCCQDDDEFAQERKKPGEQATKKHPPPQKFSNDQLSSIDNHFFNQSADSKKNLKSKTPKKKKCAKEQQKSNAVPVELLNSQKYKGFVISAQAAQQQTQRRRVSTDSAFSVTESEDGVDQNEEQSHQDDVFDKNDDVIDSDVSRRFSSDSNKDSGVDEELEQLCVRMCESVVSGPDESDDL